MIIKKIKLKNLIFLTIVLTFFIGGFLVVPHTANAKITDIFETVCKPGSVDGGKTWEAPAAAGEEMNAQSANSCTVCPGGTTKCSDNICRISCVGVDPITCTDGKKGVYVIGDNLTVGMEDEGKLSSIISTLGWNPVVVNGKQGRDIADGIDLITNNDEVKQNIKKSGAVVIALGTAGTGENLKQKMGILFNKLQDINPGVRYYFVNYSSTKDLSDEMKKRSNSLSSFVDDNKKDGAVLVDWDQANKAAEPPYTDSDDCTLGIHPIGFYTQMARLVAGKIGQMPKGGVCATGSCGGVEALRLARTQLGKPYLLGACWGWNNPNYKNSPPPEGCPKTDCAAMVNWSWYWASNKKIDILEPYGTGVIADDNLKQYATGNGGNPPNGAIVGDVLAMYNIQWGSGGNATYSGHIAMYAGNGNMIESVGPVQEVPLYSGEIRWAHVIGCD